MSEEVARRIDIFAPVTTIVSSIEPSPCRARACAAIIIYCRFGVLVGRYTSYDLVRSGIHPELLLCALLDTADAQGGLAARHRGPAGRQAQDSRRKRTLSWRHCGLHRLPFHCRHPLRLRPGT